MKPNKTIIVIAIFVILELIAGFLVGKYYLENYHSSGNESLQRSILRFYLGLNIIFFGSTTALGIISLVVLRKWDRLSTTILSSIKIGLVFLAIYTLSFSFLSYTLNIRQSPLFFTLLGFIIGFNYGILKKEKSQSLQITNHK